MNSPIDHPLTYVRGQHGWSQEDLAREIRRAAARRGLHSGTRRNRVWRWESGRATPDIDSQVLLADVFDTDPELITALGWPYWLPGREEMLPLGASTVPALREALQTAMDRRTFLAYSGAALASLAEQWSSLEPGRIAGALEGKGVDADLVECLESTSSRLAALATEQRQHTSALLDAHLETVTDLIDAGRYGHAVGQRLHSLAATLSTTIGWHRFDQGRHSAAARCWHAALHSAHAAADRDRGAGLLSDLAYQSTWQHQPGTAVQILGHAVTRTSHPVARSLLHLRKARAHAALGEAAACRRDLGKAERSLGAPSSEPSPSWCAWMSPADLAVDSGRCLMDLGEHRRARDLLREGMALLPAARDKTKGVFLLYDADSLLKTGDIEQAAVKAHESLTLATRIGAPRCVRLVRDLAPAFTPYQSVQGVPELLRLA